MRRTRTQGTLADGTEVDVAVTVVHTLAGGMITGITADVDPAASAVLQRALAAATEASSD